MKKLLFLLLLSPFMAMAEYLPGTVTFNDGTTKTGFMEEPATEDSKKLKFRTSKDGETEKILIDEVKSLTFTTKDKRVVTYLTLKLAEPRTLKKEFKISEKKSWVRVEKAGTLNIVTAYSVGGGGGGYVYYVHKPWEDHCYYLTVFYGGLTFSVGEFKAIKMYVDVMFKDDCPKLAESLTKEDYKKNGLDIIADNFEKLCGDKH